MSALPVDSDSLNLTGMVTVKNPRPIFMGNYSYVFEGNFGEQTVAVKVIKATGDLHSVRRKVLRERTIWASLTHENILPFRGFADDQIFGLFESPFGALISPWYGNRDAGRFLGERGELMPSRERIELWKGVIDGVVYLHHHNPLIVHGDLKPGNVLIDDLGKPRLCDFGLSRVFLDQPGSGLTTTSEHTGTERYLAPELVQSEGMYPTTASDIWALGCLGLEFIHLQRPYANRKNNLRGIIVSDLKRGVAPAKGPPQPSCRLWDVISCCWSANPDDRPSATTTAGSLRRRTTVFSLQIFERIVGFAAEEEDAEEEDGWGVIETDRDIWRRRNEFLIKLCLLSKTFYPAAMTALYRHIRIYIDSGLKSLNMLVSSLRTSSARATQSVHGHGVHTNSLALIVGPIPKWGGIDPEDGTFYKLSIDTLIFKGFSSAVRLMCSLQSATITERNDSAKLLHVLNEEGFRALSPPLDLVNMPTDYALDSRILSACREVTSKSLEFYPSQKLLLLCNISLHSELVQIVPNTLGIHRLFAISPHYFWVEGSNRPNRAWDFLPGLRQLVVLDKRGATPVPAGETAVLPFLAVPPYLETPNITSLHIETTRLSKIAPSNFYDFLGSCRNTLRHLTLDIHTIVQSDIPELSRILSICQEIRSVRLPIVGEVGYWPLRPHSTIESLTLTSPQRIYRRVGKHESFMWLKPFRRAALSAYPSLKNAKLIFTSASNAMESHATFGRANHLIHLVDGEASIVLDDDEVEETGDRSEEIERGNERLSRGVMAIYRPR